MTVMVLNLSDSHMERVWRKHAYELLAQRGKNFFLTFFTHICKEIGDYEYMRKYKKRNRQDTNHSLFILVGKD